MKKSLRKLTNGLLLVGLGVLLYYAGPVAHELLRGQPDSPALEAAPLLADSPLETAGNEYLFNSLVSLERRRSVYAEAAQTGFIEGRLVESTGHYVQSGHGKNRRFHLRLEGRVTDHPVRLDQVSDGRFLWTDQAWGDVNQLDLRQVWRIDLRRLRKSLANTAASPMRPGEASTDAADPRLWSGLGGAPMLLESLRANFDFALPRQMWLRKQPVYAMVGFWKDELRKDLLVSPKDKTNVNSLPSRMPHHVLVVIGAADLFPYRVEYRGADDPLSSATLSPDARYGESARPLLKLDFMRPKFDGKIASDEFVYTLPQGIDWMDRTTERLEMLRKRQQIAIAQSRPAAPR